MDLLDRRRILRYGAACLVLSCAAPRPSFGVRGDQGVVWADTTETAEEVAEALDRVVPKVRAILGEFRDVEPEVWVQSTLGHVRWMAAPQYVEGLVPANSDCIYIREDSIQQWPADGILAHELTHLLLNADLRREMPWAVEEAVCETVAQDIAPETVRAEAWWMLFMALWSATGKCPDVVIEYDLPNSDDATVRIGSINLDVEPEAAGVLERNTGASLSNRDRPGDELTNRRWRGEAFFVVQRIARRSGVRGVVDMLESIAVAPSTSRNWQGQLCERAGLPESPELWVGEIRHDLEKADMRAAFAGPRGFRWPVGLDIDTANDEIGNLPASVIGGLMAAYPGDGPIDALVRGNLRISLVGSGVSVPIAEVPYLKLQIEESWMQKRKKTEQ